MVISANQKESDYLNRKERRAWTEVPPTPPNQSMDGVPLMWKPYIPCFSRFQAFGFSASNIWQALTKARDGKPPCQTSNQLFVSSLGNQCYHFVGIRTMNTSLVHNL